MSERADRLITAKEVAGRFAVAESRVTRGKIPPFDRLLPVAKHPKRYLESDVNQILKETYPSQIYQIDEEELKARALKRAQRLLKFEKRQAEKTSKK